MTEAQKESKNHEGGTFSDRVIEGEIWLARKWYAPDGRFWKNEDGPVPAGSGYKLSELPATARLSRDQLPDKSNTVWVLRGEPDPSTRALVETRRLEVEKAGLLKVEGKSDAEVKIIVREAVKDALEEQEDAHQDQLSDLNAQIAALKKQLEDKPVDQTAQTPEKTAGGANVGVQTKTPESPVTKPEPGKTK